MNRQQFNDLIKKNDRWDMAVEWCDQHPELSVQELLSICPRGDWMLWAYEKVGYAPDVLATVAYRAATRSMGYAADKLDRAGIQHGLRGLIITDAESAQVAEDAARAARAAGAAALAAQWAAEDAAAAAAAEAAEWAAGAAARTAGFAAAPAAAARAAEWSAIIAEAAALSSKEDAYYQEHSRCADDCRELLPELRIEV